MLGDARHSQAARSGGSYSKGILKGVVYRITEMSAVLPNKDPRTPKTKTLECKSTSWLSSVVMGDNGERSDEMLTISSE